MPDLIPEVGNVDVIVVLRENVPLYWCPGVHLGAGSDLLHHHHLGHLNRAENRSVSPPRISRQENYLVFTEDRTRANTRFFLRSSSLDTSELRATFGIGARGPWRRGWSCLDLLIFSLFLAQLLAMLSCTFTRAPALRLATSFST